MLIKNPPDRKPSGPSNKRAIRLCTVAAVTFAGVTSVCALIAAQVDYKGSILTVAWHYRY